MVNCSLEKERTRTPRVHMLPQWKDVIFFDNIKMELFWTYRFSIPIFKDICSYSMLSNIVVYFIFINNSLFYQQKARGLEAKELHYK